MQEFFKEVFSKIIPAYNMSVFELFKKLPLFKGVDSDELFTLISRISLDFDNVLEGDFLFKKTDSPEGLIFLLQGKVEISDSINSRVFSENSILSFTGLFGKDLTFSNYARAVEDSSILTIDRKSLLYMFKINDTILCNYLGMLSELANSVDMIKYLENLRK